MGTKGVCCFCFRLFIIKKYTYLGIQYEILSKSINKIHNSETWTCEYRLIKIKQGTNLYLFHIQVWQQYL